MARTLILFGVLLVVAGLLWMAGERLGRLPGDIVFERGGVRVYLPLTTCLIISALISLVMWLIGR